MLSGIFTVLGVVSKLLGLADFAEKMFQRAQDRRQGMLDQKAADNQATVDAATEGQKAAGRIAGESPAQVREDLKNDFRD